MLCEERAWLSLLHYQISSRAGSLLRHPAKSCSDGNHRTTTLFSLGNTRPSERKSRSDGNHRTTTLFSLGNTRPSKRKSCSDGNPRTTTLFSLGNTRPSKRKSCSDGNPRRTALFSLGNTRPSERKSCSDGNHRRTALFSLGNTRPSECRVSSRNITSPGTTSTTFDVGTGLVTSWKTFRTGLKRRDVAVETWKTLRVTSQKLLQPGPRPTFQTA